MRLVKKQEKEERFEAFLAALEKAMAAEEVSKPTLAKAVGYSSQQISDVLKRKSRPSLKLQTSIAKAFDYPTLDAFLNYGRGVNAENGASEVFTARVSITRRITGLDKKGELVIEEGACDAYTPQENLEALGLTADDLWVYVVNDDTMLPHIPRNSLAFVNLNNTVVQTGMAYLLRVGEELTLRLIESTPEGLLVKAIQPGLTSFVVSGKDLPGFKIFGQVAMVHQPPMPVHFYKP